MTRPKRRFDKYTAKGIEFYFKYDDVAPDLLHIYARHLTAPTEAIETYFYGETTWNERYKRFETSTDSHGIYWLYTVRGNKVRI